MLALSLVHNRSLESLELRHNSVDDWGCGWFGMALKRNRTLKVLDLRQNPVGENGHGEFSMVKKATKREIQVDPVLGGMDLDGRGEIKSVSQGSAAAALSGGAMRDGGGAEAGGSPAKLLFEARKRKFGVIKLTESGRIANRYMASESECFKPRSARLNSTQEKAYGAEFVGEQVRPTAAESNVRSSDQFTTYRKMMSRRDGRDEMSGLSKTPVSKKPGKQPSTKYTGPLVSGGGGGGARSASAPGGKHLNYYSPLGDESSPPPPAQDHVHDNTTPSMGGVSTNLHQMLRENDLLPGSPSRSPSPDAGAQPDGGPSVHYGTTKSFLLRQKLNARFRHADVAGRFRLKHRHRYSPEMDHLGKSTSSWREKCPQAKGSSSLWAAWCVEIKYENKKSVGEKSVLHVRGVVPFFRCRDILVSIFTVVNFLSDRGSIVSKVPCSTGPL